MTCIKAAFVPVFRCRSLTVSGLLCASLLLGCSDDDKSTKAEIPTVTKDSASKNATGNATGNGNKKKATDDDKGHLETMDHNFDSAITLIDAIVAGDLKVAKAYGVELARLKVPKSDKSIWQTQFSVISKQGALIAKAESLQKVADLTGPVLTACAACHVKLDAGPKTVRPDDMPRDLMTQHQWASDRLVDGVYDPDDANWIAGAKTMHEAVLISRSAKKHARGKKGKKRLKLAKKVAKEVHALPLLDAKGQTARAKAYGQLITTCTKCHQALKVKMRTPDLPLPR